MSNRHEYRRSIVFALYQHLLLHWNLHECFAANFEKGQDEFVRAIANDLCINKDKYIEELSPYLNKWTFDRLNLVEQAILLMAASEISQKLNDNAVVIDEAVILAKEYCDDDAYRFINGVLDSLCNKSVSVS